MTSIVLALAGLTAGDGGPGTGAATAQAEFNPLAGSWVGTWRWSLTGATGRAELRGGVVRTFDSNGRLRFAVVVVREDGGRLRLRDDSGVWPGIYRLDGGRLVICAADVTNIPRPNRFDAPNTNLFTFRPAARRKP
ncbi:MAG TPA: hypothetical protein VFE78_25715 [Gemmataceae bacterium]|jgi:hypothetical protein|nr:hypothetical protein [Gemmataceae bacterium]